MAKRTVITLIDDIDGTDAAETIAFTIDGASYEIDLSTDNATKFRSALEPYTTMARDLPQPQPWPANSMDQMIVKAKSLAVHEDCIREVRRGLAGLHGFDPADEEAAAIWDTVKSARAFAARQTRRARRCSSSSPPRVRNWRR